jgi:signal transduction histidine kinase
MLWLPEPIESRATGRLPLADLSAAVLASVLIAGPNQRNTALLCQAMGQDPALALWALARASAGGGGELRSVAALAGWLASNCRDALTCPETGSQAPANEAWHKRYRRLVAISVAVGCRARDLAAGQNGNPDEAYLIGLLHSPEWWSLDPALPRDRHAGSPVVAAGWLADALDRLHQVAALDGNDSIACVARARQTIDETAVLDELAGKASANGNTLVGCVLALLSDCVPELARQAGQGRPSQDDFERRLEAAKLDALGELAAGAGHEINNPIAVIAGRAQLLLDGETNPRRRRELAVINTQAMRVYEMIADMMLFARPPALKRVPCDLVGIVRQVAAELAPQSNEPTVEIISETPDTPVMVEGDQAQLAVALRAICDNALTAVGHSGRVVIRVDCVSPRLDQNGAWATVTVSDTGPGISPEAADHLFDPFYSGRPAGRGLGMGLAKAWRIIHRHQGHIKADSSNDQGAKVTLSLPHAWPNDTLRSAAYPHN